MRKIMITILCCFIIMGGLTQTAAAAVKIVVDGSGDEYPHYLDMRIAPEIENDIVVAPLRDLANELAWSITWDEKKSGIYIQGNGNNIQMYIGDRRALVNTVRVDMPIPPRLSDGITMIPLAFVAEAMGYHVTSSKVWNNLNQIYVTPYNLISDMELVNLKADSFTQSTDSGGFITLKLNKDKKTPGGIGLNDAIWDVLQVYGVPRGPERTLNYPGDWTGTLVYWGTFVPNSEMGTFYEFTFNRGILMELTISC